MTLGSLLVAILLAVNLAAFAALQDQSLKNRRMRRISRAFLSVQFINFLWWLTGEDLAKRGWPLTISVVTLAVGAIIAYYYEENP